jgi:hypothetical protein
MRNSGLLSECQTKPTDDIGCTAFTVAATRVDGRRRLARAEAEMLEQKRSSI